MTQITEKANVMSSATAAGCMPSFTSSSRNSRQSSLHLSQAARRVSRAEQSGFTLQVLSSAALNSQLPPATAQAEASALRAQVAPGVLSQPAGQVATASVSRSRSQVSSSVDVPAHVAGISSAVPVQVIASPRCSAQPSGQPVQVSRLLQPGTLKAHSGVLAAVESQPSGHKAEPSVVSSKSHVLKTVAVPVHVPEPSSVPTQVASLAAVYAQPAPSVMPSHSACRDAASPPTVSTALHTPRSPAASLIGQM